MNLAAHGIAVDLPPGWEGRIRGRAGDTPPVVHLSTTAIPPGHADFGSGVVEHLGPDDVFVALLEYTPDCADTPLFARQGLPRRLRSRGFNRRALQRTLAHHCGQQLFFTEHGRAFCLYVVLGRDHDTGPLLDKVHQALAGIRIGA